MAVYRNSLGNIDKQEFENHLKARIRKEGYIEILMYTPDLDVSVASITSNDMLDFCDISNLHDIETYTSETIATLEENLWLLNGRFVVYQGGTVNSYISSSMSNQDGEFTTTPTMTVQLAHPHKVENFSILLNSAVPSGYPKQINVNVYDNENNLLKTVTQYIEWEEETGEVDEDDEPIYRTVLLEGLPSVNFEINTESVDHLEIEYIDTRVAYRRLRISNIMFAKTFIFNQDQITNVDYIDKTSYVCDTLPSRVFKFNVNNYTGTYDIDNPNNEYIKLNRQTRVRFRNGYNVYGYEYDSSGYVAMIQDTPVVDYEQEGVEIEWDNWKELRLMDVSANADESATFTAGSLLDIMEDNYTKELFTGGSKTVGEIAEDILNFEGLPLNSIEWSSDNIKRPLTAINPNLPYSQWPDTRLETYPISACVPELPCKQIIQLLAFSVGATILILDNGHLKFAYLNIDDPSTFTNNYTWDYKDFESIPAAEQLPSVDTILDISLPKYKSQLDRSGENSIKIGDTRYYNCTIITTVTCTTMNTEVTYNDCYPIGCRIKSGESFKGNIAYSELYCHRGIIELGGFESGDSVQVEILGYPITTKQTQERYVTSNSLILDTKIMYQDVSSYNQDGTLKRTEEIKRKYLEWYKKKFKYTITTRGEPLINAGDYGIIQTQFTEKMPVYILQNHWTFDGAWSGDMEVIALD